MDGAYWRKRRGLRYYREVLRMVTLHAPLARTLLDVGTGPTLYLNDYVGSFSRIVALDKKRWPIWDSLNKAIHTVGLDFSRASLGEFDVVMCLQCLEHIPDAEKPGFIANLFKHTGFMLVVSLPYLWTKSKEAGHVGIDEKVIRGWFGVDPIKSRVIEEVGGGQRIINIYEAK